MRPRPATLQLTSTQGTVSVVEVSNGMTWAELARSVEAMQPELVQALAADGKILRAVRPQEMDDDDDEPVAAAPVPTFNADAETARFTLVANLLAQAHTNSFDALVAITQGAQARAESLERTLMQIDRDRRNELADREDLIAEKEETLREDPLSQMAGAFMGGKEQAAAAAPAARGKPNGKA